MGLMECASGKSIWRGYDYYEDKRVLNWKETEPMIFEGDVKGSGNQIYHAVIDVEHSKKHSSCNCAFAEGRRVICKHQIAMYFTIFPKEAERLLKEAEEYEKEEEKRRQEHYEDLRRYVKSLSKSELQERLLYYIIEEEERRERGWW